MGKRKGRAGAPTPHSTGRPLQNPLNIWGTLEKKGGTINSEKRRMTWDKITGKERGGVNFSY